MVSPVPGFPITTPYGRRGSWWSCNEDANGNGVHTGSDYAAPSGTPVVAARPGKVVWSAHGSAFGSHQVDVLPGDGTRDFYAHMRSRVANGTWVEAGEKIGEVGAEGNVSGPHLHFERHATEYGGWSCSVHRDPAPSHNWEDEDTVKDEDIENIARRVNKALGDYDADGGTDAKDPEYADQKIKQIEAVVRRIEADVQTLLEKLT
jgi:murein DD-endopeptidase MepM/ murein hydrolase activator NlpD